MKAASLHEAEAHAALERARNHSRALGATLDEAAHALTLSRLEDFERQLAKLIEWQRFVAVRLDLLAKRVGAGE
jgi:hypothetical protein